MFNYLLIIGLIAGINAQTHQSVAPVTRCFDDCALQFPPLVTDSSYAACRHGCRYAQYTYTTQHTSSSSTPYHLCYSYCASSYKGDLAHQEACVFSCKTSYHSDSTPLLPPAGQASLPTMLYNQTASSKCLGQLYSTIDAPKCFAYINMWQFNYNTFKCEKFVYGGCPEIPNLFETQSECEKECGPLATAHAGHHHQQSQTTHASPPKCLSPTYAIYLKVGGLDCDNYVDKIQFNFDSGECEPFKFGGCLDLDNMFDTIAECANECSPFTMPPTTEPPTTVPTTTTTMTPYKVVTEKKSKNSAAISSLSGITLIAASMSHILLS